MGNIKGYALMPINSTLSYFKSKEDYPLSCRGGISMRIANIHLPDSEDKSRFEIVGKGSVRYSLKARTPTDAKKWIWALVEAKNYLEQQEKNNTADLHDANATDWVMIFIIIKFILFREA
jgi:hypothetical protein